MTARLFLNAALALAVAGMAAVTLGVIAPATFLPGVYVLDIAAIGLVVAGIMYLRSRPDKT